MTTPTTLALWIELNKESVEKILLRFHFFGVKRIQCYMLKTQQRQFYQVKKGQTLAQIAENFSVSPFLLVKINALATPPCAGQILQIPNERGNLYVVQEGDTKTLLCGSEENYRALNGTDVFYLGMRVVIPT